MLPACSTPAFLKARQHRLRIGRPEDHPFLKRQTRLAFARCGITDPLSLDDYRGSWRLQGPGARHCHWRRPRPSRRSSPRACAAAAAQAFPPASNGAPWPKPRRQQKYIVCNADEGDSGTFADRMMMEGDPFCLIEGMAIAGLAHGRHQGLHLYPLRISARHRGHAARPIVRAREHGLLGRAAARFGLRLRHGGARRRRRLCLRRGDGAAR